MQPAVLYIPYATSSNEQTSNIITFAQIEEGDLVGNGCIIEEYESILALIYESYKDDDSDYRYISTNTLK